MIRRYEPSSAKEPVITMSSVYANKEAQRDPTRSTVLRRRYAQRLRGWFGKLNATIRTAVQSRNVFSINESDPTPPGVFGFPRDDQKVEAFIRWLEQQEQQGILDIVSSNDNKFVRSGYEKGVRHANEALEEAGYDVPDRDVENIFNLPVHQDALQLLYTRNFDELKGITEAMNQAISRELAEGFQRGENPTKIARRITDTVDDIGKRRATTLARTEVIRAHSEATLNRFERFGVGEVTVKAEWSTAGDRRVCPICRALEGKTFTISEARESTFSFEGKDYPLRPPAHPNCRCALIPSTERDESADVSTTTSESEGVFGPVSRDPVAEGLESLKETGDFKKIRELQSRQELPSDESPLEIWQSLRDNAEDNFIDALEDTEARVRINELSLKKVLDDGRFKTQFEVPVSGGGYNPDIRRKFEREFFGLSDDLPDEDRPIYGYLSKADKGPSDYRSLDQYGDIDVVLKDDVRERTTMTIGDSMADNERALLRGNDDVSTVPTPLNDPDLDSTDIVTQTRLADDQITDLTEQTRDYAEIQVHNGVSTDDIDRVIFSEDPDEELVEELRESGIDVEGEEGVDIPTVTESTDDIVPDDLPDRWATKQINRFKAKFPDDASEEEKREILDNMVEAADDGIKDFVDDTEVRVRAPVDVVEDIADDGRFKTQFETNTSGGQLATDKRSALEKELFGVDPDTDPENRPIYGYLRKNGSDTTDEWEQDQYGNAVFHLSDDVRDRTTFTYGDSLGNNSDVVDGGNPTIIPSKITDPSPRSLGTYDLDDLAEGESKVPSDAFPYTEAQVHEGVSIDDVEKVTFEEEPDDSALEALEERGIDVEIID